jgi:hypothetical protein
MTDADDYVTPDKRDSHGRFAKGGRGGPGRQPREAERRIDRMYLAGAIRDMLEQEADEESGKPRLLELIHVAYTKAKSGDPDAMKLLFERGYGKTPPVYQLDPRIMLEQLCAQNGLTLEDIKNDPIASYFFGLVDNSGNGATRLIETPTGIEATEGSESGQQILESG